MPTLDDQLLAHQINSIKHGAAIGRSVRSYLDEIKQVIRKRVAGFDSDTRTAKRLEKLLDTLAKEISKPAGEWRKSLEKQLKEFATYEIKYQAETISEWVGVNLTEPTFNQVWTAAQFNPVALSATNAVDFAGWLKSWDVDEVARLVMGVKSGFVEGLTVRQILKNVVGAGGLADVSERNAMTMARTMTMHLASEARFETYKENDDIIEGYALVATLDKSTSSYCRSIDGTKIYFTDEKQLKPPFHANCLSFYTDVSTCSAVSNIYKRAYKGRMINIRTSSGRSLSVTPNHPILTTTGWVNAGLIDCSSKLICCNNVIAITEHQKDNVIAKISDIFSSAYISSDALSVAIRPSTTEDFHGDGTNGEVEIVSIDSLTWDKVKSSLRQQAANDQLPSGKIADFALFSDSSIDELGISGYASSSGFVSASGEIGDLLWSAIREPNNHGVGSVSHANSRLDNPNDWLFTQSERLSDVDWANTGLIEIDDVVNVSVTENYLGGHVYNLENENNWYIANGIIAHNCRTTTKPLLSSEFDFLDKGAKRPQKGAEGPGQTSADVTYYSWLKTQPAAFQDEILGQTKGAIFRNAGLDAEEFRKLTVDDLGKSLTLTEMQQADSRIAKYMRDSNSRYALD